MIVLRATFSGYQTIQGRDDCYITYGENFAEKPNSILTGITEAKKAFVEASVGEEIEVHTFEGSNRMREIKIAGQVVATGRKTGLSAHGLT